MELIIAITLVIIIFIAAKLNMILAFLFIILFLPTAATVMNWVNEH